MVHLVGPVLVAPALVALVAVAAVARLLEALEGLLLEALVVALVAAPLLEALLAPLEAQLAPLEALPAPLPLLVLEALLPRLAFAAPCVGARVLSSYVWLASHGLPSAVGHGPWQVLCAPQGIHPCHRRAFLGRLPRTPGPPTTW